MRRKKITFNLFKFRKWNGRHKAQDQFFSGITKPSNDADFDNAVEILSTQVFSFLCKKLA